MYRRFFLAFFLALGTLLAILPSAQAAPGCQFVLGFAALHDKLPTIVGACVENEHTNVATGDSLQQTVNGLLVWRKADNWTAFTNGAHTWVNGPYGIQERLNTERFSWEANPEGLAVVSTAHYIVIHLGAQTLTAYEGNTAVLHTLITTGQPALSTPLGTSSVFYRASPYQFISPWPLGSYYYYPPSWVNWALEYRSGGYFLHDAPWQPDGTYGPGSEYGPYASHGCVHVPPGAMRYLFSWAGIGTPVSVLP